MPAPEKSLRPKRRPEKEIDVSPRAEKGDIELMLLEEEERKRKRKQRMREYQPTKEEAGAIERGNRVKRLERREGFYLGGEVRAGDVRDNPNRGKCY